MTKTDIRVYSDLFECEKFQDLVEYLSAEEADWGRAEDEAIALLVRFWSWLGGSRPDGVIGPDGKRTRKLVTNAIQRNFEPLLETGWVDEIDGKLVAHEWGFHQPWAAEFWRRSWRGKRAACRKNHTEEPKPESCEVCKRREMRRCLWHDCSEEAVDGREYCGGHQKRDGDTLKGRTPSPSPSPSPSPFPKKERNTSDRQRPARQQQAAVSQPGSVVERQADDSDGFAPSIEDFDEEAIELLIDKTYHDCEVCERPHPLTTQDQWVYALCRTSVAAEQILEYWDEGAEYADNLDFSVTDAGRKHEEGSDDKRLAYRIVQMAEKYITGDYKESPPAAAATRQGGSAEVSSGGGVQWS